MRSPKNIALSVLLFCASVGAWEGLVRLFEVPAFILPPPSQVAPAAEPRPIRVKHAVSVPPCTSRAQASASSVFPRGEHGADDACC